uniref:Uncharacterized protein n=1 Tax=Cacopsylla melanoneura TaxID=428564 RepID=A0A8D9F7U2_9HEMI
MALLTDPSGMAMITMSPTTPSEETLTSPSKTVGDPHGTSTDPPSSRTLTATTLTEESEMGPNLTAPRANLVMGLLYEEDRALTVQEVRTSMGHHQGAGHSMTGRQGTGPNLTARLEMGNILTDLSGTSGHRLTDQSGTDRITISMDR